MKTTAVKAVVAISEFLTYNVDPEEFIEVMQRASTLEDTSRDREIMRSLAQKLTKAIKG